MSNKYRPACFVCKTKMNTLSQRENGKQRARAYQCPNGYSYHSLQGELLIPISTLQDFNAESTGKEIYDRHISAVQVCSNKEKGEGK